MSGVLGESTGWEDGTLTEDDANSSRSLTVAETSSVYTRVSSVRFGRPKNKGTLRTRGSSFRRQPSRKKRDLSRIAHTDTHTFSFVVPRNTAEHFSISGSNSCSVFTTYRSQNKYTHTNSCISSSLWRRSRAPIEIAFPVELSFLCCAPPCLRRVV